MNNLYTEIQYKEYLNLMDNMANCNDIIKGAHIHEEINSWLGKNNISELAEQQMSERIEKECEAEMSNK